MKNTNESYIKKFNADKLESQEIHEMERLFLSGEINIEDLDMYTQLDNYLENQSHDLSATDYRFKDMLSEEIKKQDQKEKRKNWFTYLPLSIKWAIPTCLVLLGFFGGQFWNAQSSALSINPIAQNENTLMYAMINHPSSNYRMMAVNDASQISNTDQTIKMLFLSLNHDNSSSVRMAAIDALMQYADDENVRKELINSISEQTSPLVVQYISEALKIIGEKMTLDRFRSLYNNDIPLDVIDQMEANLHITKL